jgi:hypothetical protein
MDIDPRVTAAFGQHGVLTREQLLDLGVAPSEIRRMLRQGRWIRVRRGAYTTAEIWEAADAHIGRARLRTRAAVLQMRRGWRLSHDSAAHELELTILRSEDPLVHVTRPGYTNAWTENGVKHHLARFSQEQVVVVNGMQALDLARTAVDIARERGLSHGLVACDGALRMGVTRDELKAAVAPMENWPGSRAARRAVELADPGAENPHESLGRELVIEAGLPRPVTQFPVSTAEGVKWCDMLVGNQVIETDGRLKYLSPADGGVADRSAEEVAWEERKRERLVRDRNLVVTRVYWEDYYGRRRADAIRRLQADHADACARFGPETDPVLLREAEEIRRRHGDRAPRRRTA